MSVTRHFTPELFGFLAELADNNTREWFAANRERYRRAVQEPLLGFIAALAGPLGEISPHFVADPRPQGGSMFRIHRDIRFSRDKSPYKTHAAAQFRHRAAGDVHAPGFYLHLEPGGCFAGAGVWRPDGSTLTAIRQAIAADPEAWRAAVSGEEFAATHRLVGESLRRPPRGVDPEHPLIEDLKRKEFVSTTSLSEDEVLGADFVRVFTQTCRTASPLVAFLCDALGLPYRP